MPDASFTDYALPEPDPDAVAAEHRGLHRALDGARTPEAARTVVECWDGQRQQLESWISLARIRFSQDTRDEAAGTARQRADELAPRFGVLDVAIMRRLLKGPLRARLAEHVPPQAFALWECAVAVDDEAIEADQVREAELYARYQALVAGAELPFRGQLENHSSLLRFLEDPDRATRHEAATLRWGWFHEQREALDQLYDQLVQLRTGMARTLGHESFVPMGYKRMQRTDYGPAEVAGYRDAIAQHVVPLAAELRERQRGALGLDRLMAWDEPLTHPKGNPRPRGDRADLVQKAIGMFEALSPQLGAFFSEMVRREQLDLDARAGKAPGGYCDFLHSLGMPFIFANFNGTQADVDVFTHEMGHAYQVWSSRERFPLDLRWPSMDAAEIHSMSLEMLSAPQMERFFEKDAERYRWCQLQSALLFLPYGAAVDHFQHEVYGSPNLSPEERRGVWRELERRYLPWRDPGDLPHLPEGGMWQAQLHVFGMPFYYIDYTLAQVCALQYARWAERDMGEAMDSYQALCRRGGEAPFQTLVRDAGLTSPLDAGCLEDVVRWARDALG